MKIIPAIRIILIFTGIVFFYLSIIDVNLKLSFAYGVTGDSVSDGDSVSGGGCVSGGSGTAGVDDENKNCEGSCANSIVANRDNNYNSSNNYPTPADPAGDSNPTNHQHNANLGGESSPTTTPDYNLFNIKNFSQSPWFAISSGLASIIGLLVTLYGTQVRSIPFSLYRSLTWNRVIYISIGFGIIIYSSIKYYYHREAGNGFILFTIISEFVRGKHNEPQIFYNNNSINFYSLLIFIGIFTLIRGFRYNPVFLSKKILLREFDLLIIHRKNSLNSMIKGKKIEEIDGYEKILYDDMNKFYAEVQERLVDIVYGKNSIYHYKPQRSIEMSNQPLP